MNEPGDARGGSTAQLRNLLSAAAALLGVECVGVLLIDSAGQLRTVASTGPAAEHLERAQAAAGVGPGPQVNRTGELAAVPDLRVATEYGSLGHDLAPYGVGAVLSAPLWVQGAVAGNLNAVQPGPHEWTPRERAGLLRYAELVSDLLQLVAGPSPGAVRRFVDAVSDPEECA